LKHGGAQRPGLAFEARAEAAEAEKGFIDFEIGREAAKHAITRALMSP
jgi:hypothetical protein